MNAHDLNQIAPVSVQRARGARPGEPWRVRVTFAGANAANASGKSDKWWQAASDGRGEATVSWGATGSNGQSQRCDAVQALRRAEEKLRKGYGYPPDAGASRPVGSLQDLVNRATWRPATRDRLLLLAGEHGWVSIELPMVATISGSLPVLPYVAQDGALWGVVVLSPTDLSFARIRA